MSAVAAALSRVLVTIAEANISRRRLGIYVWKIGLPGCSFRPFFFLKQILTLLPRLTSLYKARYGGSGMVIFPV